MKSLRYLVILFWMLTCSVASAEAQVSIGIGLPNVSIDINLPLFPELVPVPGYPVYYAPRLDANYFFYDGMYWVYQDDNWYASSWYNGPWWIVQPEVVPLFILRVPVRYYRQPPVYFRGWHSNAPPRWGQHWGHGWEQRRKGWDHWKRSSVPSRAPLPVYQRQYSGDRYPRFEQQQKIRGEHYRYQPRTKAVRELRQVEGRRPEPAERRIQEVPRMRGPEHQDIRRSAPPQQGSPAAPSSQPTRRGSDDRDRSPSIQNPSRQREPGLQDQRQPQRMEQREQRLQHREERSEDRGRSQEHQRGRGQDDRKDGEHRGRGRD